MKAQEEGAESRASKNRFHAQNKYHSCIYCFERVGRKVMRNYSRQQLTCCYHCIRKRGADFLDVLWIMDREIQ